MADDNIETPEEGVEILPEGEQPETPAKELPPEEHNRKGFEMRKGKAKVETPDFAEMEQRITNKVISGLAVDTLEEELATLPASTREKVKAIYDKDIVKSGASRSAIRTDLKKAFAIANAELTEKEANEIRETELAKRTVKTGAGMGGSIPSATDDADYDKVLTPHEIEFGKKRNWTQEQFKKAAAAKLEERNS